ncbi:unnamed protein product [Amoebophrya sp. A120]|nr:unnamed protein product [Amoebophrya sp. A120]|eukprot:GSA120T00003452001.1
MAKMQTTTTPSATSSPAAKDRETTLAKIKSVLGHNAVPSEGSGSPDASPASTTTPGVLQESDELSAQLSPSSLPDQRIAPYVIGVCGSTCSGKTTLCKILRRELKNLDVAFIPSDCYYRQLTPEQVKQAHAQQYDFDHPNALAFDELTNDLALLKQGQTIELPKYDFAQHARVPKVDEADKAEHTVRPADVIIVEGILIYAAGPELRDQFDSKVFIDCDSDLVVLRRLKRDISERGRDFEGVQEQYLRFVKRSWEEFVEPSKRYADVIIPNVKRDGHLEGAPAVKMLIHDIKHRLRENSLLRQGSSSYTTCGSSSCASQSPSE